MRADGDILLKSELIDPSTGSLYQLVRRVSQMAISSRRPVSQEDILVFKCWSRYVKMMDPSVVVAR